MCPICVIISLSTVLFGFWQRDGYGEREREREERRLKYIELLKGLPAVHHCHLTHVECEVPSQQPLGGHLLPHTHVRRHSHTHTHTRAEWHPKFLHSKKKENCLLLLKAAHTRAYMHTQCRSPAIFTRLPWDSNAHIWTCLHLSKWTCIVFFFFFFFFLKKKKKNRGCLNFHFLDPLASSRSSKALIGDLIWLPMINHQKLLKSFIFFIAMVRNFDT